MGAEEKYNGITSLKDSEKNLTTYSSISSETSFKNESEIEIFLSNKH